MEPYEHDPRISEIDKQLEVIEAKRIALKEEGKKLMARKAHLMMIEQITLRVLGNQPLSHNEIEWTGNNPKEWLAIKEATAGLRGSRSIQKISVK